MSQVFEPYRERAARLPGAILWTRTTDGTAQRVLPDGCMDLLWIEGDLVVAGPDTRRFHSFHGDSGDDPGFIAFLANAQPGMTDTRAESPGEQAQGAGSSLFSRRTSRVLQPHPAR